MRLTAVAVVLAQLPIAHSASASPIAEVLVINVEPVESLNSASRETLDWISDDGLEVVLQSTRSSGSSSLWDLFSASRTSIDEQFSTPSLDDFALINAPSGNAARATLSTDGLEIYYAQEVPAGPEVPFSAFVDKVFYSSRATTSDPWPAGQPLSDLDALRHNLRPQHLSDDGLRLYLSAADAVAPGTPGILHPWDLFVAERASAEDGFALDDVQVLTSLNSEFADIEISLSDDELTAILTSTRPGGTGSNDLWYAVRDSIADPFEAPLPLDSANTASVDRRGLINGNTLYFQSDRSGNEEIYSGTLLFEPAVPGDSNVDGEVDLLDLDTLGANFRTTTELRSAAGDFTGDGLVGLDDLDVLGANFGHDAASIPEPACTTPALLCISLIAVRARDTCRNRRPF